MDLTARRRVGYAVAWILATATAIAIGLLAVTAVGGTLRDRGPLGNEVARDTELGAPAPSASPAQVTSRTPLRREFGALVVGCQGAYAVTLDVRPDTAAGWRTVSFEPGPDDDVDAVFRNGRRSIDIEVFCDQGVPTLAEVERNTLPDGED